MTTFQITCNAGKFLVISENEYRAKIAFTLQYPSYKIQKIVEITTEAVHEIYCE